MEETRNAPYSNGEDKISRLPDSLIHHILSFIDTKYVVQTCVMSKRWIHIWKSLPILKFNRDSFSEDKRDSFVMFVDMVLSFRQYFDIQRFTVYWKNSGYDNSAMMNVFRWSLSAVKYNVQEMSIQIGQLHNTAYEIPHGLLNCGSLKKLFISLYGNVRYVDVILPTSMSLPQLKLLFFIGLSISNAESSKRLFSSCPVLEKLILSRCDLQTDNRRSLTVDSLSLEKFEYYDHCRRHLLPQNGTTAIIIKLCAPNLEDFTFKSYLSLDYSLEICSPLSRVFFDMTLKKLYQDENAKTYENLPSLQKVVYAKRVMKFLGAVSMVKTMRLSSGFLEVLSHSPDLLDCQPPRLCNLQHSVLEMWPTRGCLLAIAFLLKVSPNITHLVLGSKESNIGDIGDDWEAGLSLPGMLSHLKYVLIVEAEGNDAELKLLSFLLKNAKVFVKVALYLRPSVGSPDRARQIEQFRHKLRAISTPSSSIKLLSKPPRKVAL